MTGQWSPQSFNTRSPQTPPRQLHEGMRSGVLTGSVLPRWLLRLGPTVFALAVLAHVVTVFGWPPAPGQPFAWSDQEAEQDRAEARPCSVRPASPWRRWRGGVGVAALAWRRWRGGVAAWRRGHELFGVALTGLVGTTVSPFSWGHHWVWFAPLAVFLIHQVTQKPAFATWLADLSRGFAALGRW